MKIKLDENIPLVVQMHLARLGHDTDTVPNENLAGQPDTLIWQAAQESGRFLITQDLDFSDIHRFNPGSHCGILVLRLRQSGRAAIARRLLQVFSSEAVETWGSCFVVVTEHKIRIRRPEG